MTVTMQQFLLYEICIPVIMILCTLAALFNVLIFVSRFYVKTRTASLELTYSLALSDTWTSAVVAGSLFWNSYKPVVLGVPHSSFCFPLTLEAFRTGGMLTGCLHLTALGFVHYLTIVRPFDHLKVMNNRITCILLFLIWAIPPLSLMIYFASWPGEGYRSTSCNGVTFYENFYFRLNVSLLIIVLMITTCLLYWNMLRKITAVRSKATSANPRSRRTLITATLIFGTFLFGWMPASVMFILTAKDMPLYRRHEILINVLSMIVLLNIMIKSLTNPIIYATRIPEIRQFVLQKILWKLGSAREERRSEMTPLRTASVI